MLSPWRHELPAYSPLPASALGFAALDRFRGAGRALNAADAFLRARFDADQVILLDSGRSALAAALRVALGLAPGRARRIVAVPAFQCYEVASAVVAADCEVALYDIDPRTLAPDRESLERAFRSGAGTAVIAPLYGFPVDWDAMTSLADEYGAVLIEDAAQAHGAEWCGRRLGTLASLSVVSFGRGKGWTGGAGGALLVRHMRAPGVGSGWPVPRSRARTELGVAAIAAMQSLFGHAAVYGIPASIPALALGQTVYHDPTPPRRASGFSAALLLQTAGWSDREAVARRAAASFWMEALPPSVRAGAPAVVPGGMPGYLRYPLLVPEDVVPTLDAASVRRAGIARSFPRPLGELPAIRSRLASPNGEFHGARTLAQRLVTLPTHSRFGSDARARVLRIAESWRRG